MAVSNNVAFVQWLDRYIDSKLEKLVEEKVAIAVAAALKQHQPQPEVAAPAAARVKRAKRAKDVHNKQEAIRVNYFGYENYQHMLMPYLIALLTEHTDMHAVVRQVLKDLYFNPSVPANHNVYMPLDSYKSINILTRSGWQTRSLNSVLEKMVRRANDILQHYMVASNSMEHISFMEELGKKKYESLLQFTNKVDSMERYPEFKARLVKDAEHGILTCQHFIHKSICRDLVLSKLGTL